jgi:hypothetical protein
MWKVHADCPSCETSNSLPYEISALATFVAVACSIGTVFFTYGTKLASWLQVGLAVFVFYCVMRVLLSMLTSGAAGRGGAS